MQQDATSKVDAIAAEVFATLGSGRQITTFSSRPGGLTNAEAYRVTAVVERLREARGEKPVGRKIGFTNRIIWPEYGVSAPNWGYVTNRTVRDLTAAPMLLGLCRSKDRAGDRVRFIRCPITGPG